MKHFLIAILFSAFSASSAAAQGNFQLLVEFEEGVQLEIYAFNKDRKQVFSQRSLKKTMFDGKGYWIGLIDEDIVFSGQLKYLCVRDRGGKWSVPQKVGKGPKDLVCDFKPRDVGRGTYIFVPNRRK